ncbi:MAG: UDP-2,3-diacylglucosamine diphosphatase LpxI, partial [Pseudomonadota bacterium]
MLFVSPKKQNRQYMKKLGIIAAKGDLSKNFIDYSKDNYELFIVAINGITDPALVQDSKFIWIDIGEIGKAIDFFKENNVEELVFVGSLAKPDLFSLKTDMMGAKLLAKITKDAIFGDNKILSSLVEFLESNELKVLGVHEILKTLVVNAAVFTKISPNEQDNNDIEIAKQVVKELGALDIGQGVIVQNGIILGVEAIEGTDQLIKRCGELKRSKILSGILLKASKPNQELRVDLPAIGIETIK